MTIVGLMIGVGMACQTCFYRAGEAFDRRFADAGHRVADTRSAPNGDEAPALHPKMVKRVDPIYPQKALRDNLQGRVVVRFQIAPDGVPFDMTVVETPHPVLSAAALDALAKSRFEPQPPGRPIYGGRWFQQPYRFQLEDDAPAPPQTSP